MLSVLNEPAAECGRRVRYGRAMADQVIDDMEVEMNLKEVASRLGVHYMTAYRYVRQGKLEARRVGTEWRVTPAAVEVFLTAPVEAVPAGGIDWAARLVPSLREGDEPTAWAIIQRALAAGHDPAFCYLDIIAAAVGKIAEQSAGIDDQADQPIATAVAYRLVARLGASFRRSGRSRGTVVFGAPMGERHHLPIAIVADLIRLEGFDVLELGTDTHPDAFAAATRRARRLSAVALSITGAGHIDRAIEAIAAVRAVAPEVPVIVGGQAVLNPEIASLLDADGWAPDGRAATRVIRDHALRHRLTP